MSELKGYPDWALDESIPTDVRKLALAYYDLERTSDGIWLNGPEVNVICYVVAAASLLVLSFSFLPNSPIEILGILGLLAAVGIWHTKEKGLSRDKQAMLEHKQKQISLSGFNYIFGTLQKKLA